MPHINNIQTTHCHSFLTFLFSIYQLPYYINTIINQTTLKNLTVRLLETRSSTPSTIFLRLTPSRITNKKVTIIVQKSLSQLILTTLINVLGMICNNGLGNGSTNGIDLCSCSTSLYTNTDIEIGEFLLSENEDWFECFEAKGFGLD